MLRVLTKKSIDPKIIKMLGPSAVEALSKLFNLKNGLWLKNQSMVVFFKKEGKPLYSKPGTYRPISISPSMP